MLRHKTFFTVLFFTVLIWPLSSATLNFLVAETVPAGEGAFGDFQSFESSVLWEACLLDVFFEAGHIVSNSPILRLSGLGAADFPGKNSPAGEFPREIRPKLEEAALGGVDYLVLVLLSYPRGAAGPKTRPEEVNLRIYSFTSGEGFSRGGPVEGNLPGAWGFVYEGGAPLDPFRESPPGGSENGQTGPAGGEIERDRAKRLIRGLVPHIKD
ncbi:MAG: hypothetical protein LBB77_10270 [Treponema sp.]|nr:hypothetical protein [Treponema sp.]